MNRKEKLVVVKNSVANIARGGASAIVAIALPPFLTRSMGSAEYGVWSIVLQLGAYVGYLDFGIQTAVSRYVAHATERQDLKERDEIVNTAMAFLAMAGVAALALAAILSAFLPELFRQMPAAYVHQARMAVLIFSGSLALGLPASVFNGIFVGLQRNEVSALVIGGSRVVFALVVIWLAERGYSLITLAAAASIVNVASYAVLYLCYLRMVEGIHIGTKYFSMDAGRQLIGYCKSLSVWSFAMLLVTGLDLTLVGIFRFSEAAYYSVAASLIVFLAGLQNAIFTAMIPATAVLHARKDGAALGEAMLTATRYGMLILLGTGLPLIFAPVPILRLWVGNDYALRAAPLLQLLTIANVVRLSATPYVVTLIGTGQQRLVIISPLMEGITNLLVSVVAGFYFGAIGVAFGTLAGGIVGVLSNFLYNMKRTKEIAFSVRSYLKEAILRPLLCFTPIFLFVIFGNHHEWHPRLETQKLLVSVLGTAFLIFRWGLNPGRSIETCKG